MDRDLWKGTYGFGDLVPARFGRITKFPGSTLPEDAHRSSTQGSMNSSCRRWTVMPLSHCSTEYPLPKHSPDDRRAVEVNAIKCMHASGADTRHSICISTSDSGLTSRLPKPLHRGQTTILRFRPSSHRRCRRCSCAYFASGEDRSDRCGGTPSSSGRNG